MKFMKEAKENWGRIKDTQRAYVFQAVWFGKLIPGIPTSEKGKIVMLMNKVKKRIGKFPGIMYADAYKLIDDYKAGLVSGSELANKLLIFYPIKSTLTLKVPKDDLEFNKQMRLRLESPTLELINEVLIDLKKSEERDRKKILSSL